MNLNLNQRRYVIDLVNDVEAALSRSKLRAFADRFAAVRLLLDIPDPVERSAASGERRLGTAARKRETEIFTIYDVPSRRGVNIVGWPTLIRTLGLSEGTIRSRFSRGPAFEISRAWCKDGVEVVRTKRFAAKPGTLRTDVAKKFKSEMRDLGAEVIPLPTSLG